MRVKITRAALEEYNQLPVGIHGRVLAVIRKLENWPDVSGAKPMRGVYQGCHRIRTGDYRIIFREATDPKTRQPMVLVIKIGNRKDVYD